jgi:uncharacterized protein YegP (UPF0339 family)
MEGYTSKPSPLASIEKFKQYVAEGTFKAIKDKSNHSLFKRYTQSNRVAVVGEAYSTKTAAISAANSVVAFYKLAELVDLEEIAKKEARKQAAKEKRAEKKALEARQEEVKQDEPEKKAAKRPQEKKTEPKPGEPEKKAAKRPAVKKAETKDQPKTGRYNGKYEVYQAADGYAYRLKASNGEVLATSEIYSTRDGVLRAINTVKKNIETGELRVFADKKGKFKFKLTSSNHRVLLISANYAQESGAKNATESFKKFALMADIVDIELKDDDLASATAVKITSNEDKTGGKYEIEEFNGEFSWDLKASNGENLVQMEGYISKAATLACIEKFKQYVAEGTFKSIKDKTGHYQYKLYTKSNRVAAVGESYKTKTSAVSAANSVVSFYKMAEVVYLNQLAKAEAKAKKDAAKSKK